MTNQHYRNINTLHIMSSDKLPENAVPLSSLDNIIYDDIHTVLDDYIYSAGTSDLHADDNGNYGISVVLYERLSNHCMYIHYKDDVIKLSPCYIKPLSKFGDFITMKHLNINYRLAPIKLESYNIKYFIMVRDIINIHKNLSSALEYITQFASIKDAHDYLGTTIDRIDKFDGDYRYLSNFYKTDVDSWPTAEHAYQASKTGDLEILRKLRDTDSPGKAKRIGQTATLSQGFIDNKPSHMYNIVSSKFHNNRELRDKLIETYPKKLIEGNTWNDAYWGVCDGVGHNMLGRILMKVRAECMKL